MRSPASTSTSPWTRTPNQPVPGWRSATPANLIKIAAALNCPLVILERKRYATTTPPPTPTA